MRLLLIFIAAVALAFPAFAQESPQAPVVVKVDRKGDKFIAEFEFPRDAPAWGFFRSAAVRGTQKSWRPESWKILTPGVQLVKRGPVDAFVLASGGNVPRNVRIEITPFTMDLVADYVPSLRLGDGGIAIFDGHFAAFSVVDPAHLDGLPVTLRSDYVNDSGTDVRFTGKRSAFRLAGDVAGIRDGNSKGTYALYGVPVAAVSNGIATVVDKAMPKWLASDIIDFTPLVLKNFTRKMGDADLEQPTILASWIQSDLKGASLNGSALTGLIIMRLEGSQVLNPDDGIRKAVRWFIAHESAHFWIGQAVGYDNSTESWITEGGANLLAARATAELVPGYRVDDMLNGEIADCVSKGRKPISTAAERQDFRTYYACGTVFGLVAEKADGGRFHNFIRRLIADNEDDKTVTAEEWLATLDRVSGKPMLSSKIRAMLDEGSADPAKAIASLFDDAGIAYTLSENGIPRL